MKGRRVYLVTARRAAGFDVATRDGGGFEGCGLNVINPWQMQGDRPGCLNQWGGRLGKVRTDMTSPARDRERLATNESTMGADDWRVVSSIQRAARLSGIMGCR